MPTTKNHRVADASSAIHKAQAKDMGEPTTYPGTSLALLIDAVLVIVIAIFTLLASGDIGTTLIVTVFAIIMLLRLIICLC